MTLMNKMGCVLSTDTSQHCGSIALTTGQQEARAFLERSDNHSLTIRIASTPRLTEECLVPPTTFRVPLRLLQLSPHENAPQELTGSDPTAPLALVPHSPVRMPADPLTLSIERSRASDSSVLACTESPRGVTIKPFPDAFADDDSHCNDCVVPHCGDGAMSCCPQEPYAAPQITLSFFPGSSANEALRVSSRRQRRGSHAKSSSVNVSTFADSKLSLAPHGGHTTALQLAMFGELDDGDTAPRRSMSMAAGKSVRSSFGERSDNLTIDATTSAFGAKDDIKLELALFEGGASVSGGDDDMPCCISRSF